MHMDVKEPAKLGVRFNWCKCVAGRLPGAQWPQQRRRAVPAQSRHRCRVSRGAKLAKREAKLPQ